MINIMILKFLKFWITWGCKVIGSWKFLGVSKTWGVEYQKVFSGFKNFVFDAPKREFRRHSKSLISNAQKIKALECEAFVDQNRRF